MIHVAARSTNGVVIPNRKAMWRFIIETFEKNLTELRERLQVRYIMLILCLTAINLSIEQNSIRPC